MEKRGLSEKETAEYTGLSRSTLRQGRMTGKRDGRCETPPFIRAGRRVLYLRDQLDQWLEQNSTSGENDENRKGDQNE